MKLSIWFKTALIFIFLLIVGSGGFLTYWTVAPPEGTCLACHEIRASYDTWAHSSHRDINCKDCHGGTFTYGWHSIKQNSKQVFMHVSEPFHEDIRMSEQQIMFIIEKCKDCHQDAYADWISGGHSVTYADIYLHEEHNETEQPNNDCLRCHGMFFEGTIEDVVTPVSTQGPWELVSQELESRPAIPCLACHQIHAEGKPAERPDYSDPKTIAANRELRAPELGFYDRREKMYFTASILPELALREGEREVPVAPDRRQRVCNQCHAPNAFHQAGTGDDRTPRGVHEGLSCLSCHEPHSNETRLSCANCHPQLSNCGLDVETMDTTFFDPESEFNIHFVTCEDCHPDGVPEKTTE